MIPMRRRRRQPSGIATPNNFSLGRRHAQPFLTPQASKKSLLPPCTDELRLARLEQMD